MSDDLGWLKAAIDALSVSPVAAGLFDKRHNPMWTIQPSPQVVKSLLAFWRQTGEDGQIRYDLTDESWNTIVDTNLTGIFKAIRAVIPQMRTQGFGRIVATSSMGARQTAPNLAHYIAAKWGVIGLVKST